MQAVASSSHLLYYKTAQKASTCPRVLYRCSRCCGIAMHYISYQTLDIISIPIVNIIDNYHNDLIYDISINKIADINYSIFWLNIIKSYHSQSVTGEHKHSQTKLSSITCWSPPPMDNRYQTKACACKLVVPKTDKPRQLLAEIWHMQRKSVIYAKTVNRCWA